MEKAGSVKNVMRWTRKHLRSAGAVRPIAWQWLNSNKDYSSQLVWMVRAWISLPISSFNTDWTMRCLSRVDFPLNPLKWMVAFRCIPELLWPICWEEVFSRLTWPPSKWFFSFCSISSNVLIIISLFQYMKFKQLTGFWNNDYHFPF